MLNPKLHNMLVRQFGRNNVSVVNEDVELEASYARRDRGDTNKADYKLDDVTCSGEEYRINCFKCGDTRKRLYINHRWGLYDDRTGTRNLWLVNCWNANCWSDYESQRRLYTRILGDVILRPTDLRRAPPTKVARQRAIDWPGAMWMLDHMQQKMPQHEAIRYLEDRGFEPARLTRLFGVGFCVDSDLELATRRVVAPVYWSKRLVGWQARYVGPSLDKSIPKWYTCPGFKTAASLYNFDKAKRYSTVVITEGPGDVWGFGRQAVAVFGKVIRRQQLALLSKYCSKQATIVIMLDPKYDDARELAKGLPHPIERAYSLLQSSRFAGRVLKVYLPDPYDPGELDNAYMKDFVRWRAKVEGIPVEFGSRAVVVK